MQFMIQIKCFTFNPFAENTYILYDESREAVIIDPGNYEPKEHEHIVRFIGENRLVPVAILNTHAHIDHVLGISFLKNRYGIPLSLHPHDGPLLKSVRAYASNYGFYGFDEPEVEHWIGEGDVIRFGNAALRVLHVPGHAPGHVAFVSDDQKFVMGGDVLFRESIGRTDLPMGDYDTLIDSIRSKLFVLEEDYVVYPGHGLPTKIGYEKANNPFLR